MLATRSIVTALAAVVAAAGFPAAGIASVESARAVTAEDPPTGESLVATSIHSDVVAAVPGATFELGVRFRIEPKWHVYWSNPGDSGVAPVIRVSAPRGVEVGAIRWPRPTIFTTPHETTFGYEKDVLLRLPITLPASFAGERLDLAIELEWLVCRESCLFGARSMRFSLPVGSDAAPGVSPDAGLFELARKTTPRVVRLRNSELRVRLDGETLEIDGPAGGRTTVAWLPDLTPGVRPVGKVPVRGTVAGDRFSLRVPLEIRPQDVLSGLPTVAGLVLLGQRAEDPAHEVRFTWGAAESGSDPSAKSPPKRP